MNRNDMVTALGMVLAAIVLIGGRILANSADRRAPQTNTLAHRSLWIARLFLIEQVALFVVILVLILAMLILIGDAEYDWLGIIILSVAFIYFVSVFIGSAARQRLENLSYRIEIKRILDTLPLEESTRDALWNCVLALEAGKLVLAVWHGKIALESWARDQEVIPSGRMIESCILQPPQNTTRDFQRVWDKILAQDHDVLHMLWSLEPGARIPDPQRETRAQARQFLTVLWKELVDPEVLPLDLKDR